jgi:protein-S-isoprenylcysteine O-methyltransferase Ste14
MTLKGPDDRIPGVIARPPLIYLGFLSGGLALDVFWPSRIFATPLGIVVGVVVVALGAGLLAWSVATFRRAGTPVQTRRPTAVLVTAGPYRFSRNPIYIALALIHVGLALLADSAWALVLLAPALAIVRLGVIAPEEAYLATRFGDAFAAYTARVRRWL